MIITTDKNVYSFDNGIAVTRPLSATERYVKMAETPVARWQLYDGDEPVILPNVMAMFAGQEEAPTYVMEHYGEGDKVPFRVLKLVVDRYLDQMEASEDD